MTYRKPTTPTIREDKTGRVYIVGLPDAIASPGLFGSRRAAEVWLLGKDDLLSELRAAEEDRSKRRPRACMCCGKGFDSEGIHNRLCNPCRNAGSAEAMPSAFSFGRANGRRKG